MRSCVEWVGLASFMPGSGKVSLFKSCLAKAMLTVRFLGVTPDIETIGKGLNGGYQALSAVLISEKVVAGLRGGSGAFANGQTFQCHPAAAAAGIAVMEVFKTDNVVENCAKRGNEVSDSSRTTGWKADQTSFGLL